MGAPQDALSDWTREVTTPPPGTADPAGPRQWTGWCLVEMFGHRRLAGMVTADTDALLTATRVQLDIYPGDSLEPVQSHVIGMPQYCITLISEDIAREFAARNQATPIATWELQPRALTAAAGSFAADDDEPFGR